MGKKSHKTVELLKEDLLCLNHFLYKGIEGKLKKLKNTKKTNSNI